ncbi:MAG: hypothetical protein VKO65_01490 [Cyanobacteriota bacterium]|nr:hypothetical protein [Cyanobacteriota bacterium]
MNRQPTNHAANLQQQTERLPSPRRVSITIPHLTYQNLLDRSDQEGRSLSNLAAFLLESALRT